MALVIENIYKSDAKPPGTSKIYYGPEITFGVKLATVVTHLMVIYYRKFTNTKGFLVALFNFPSTFFQSKWVLLSRTTASGESGESISSGASPDYKMWST